MRAGPSRIVSFALLMLGPLCASPRSLHAQENIVKDVQKGATSIGDQLLLAWPGLRGHIEDNKTEHWATGTAGSHASYPATEGNRVQTCIDGQRCWEGVIETLQNSRTFFYMALSFAELQFYPIPGDSRNLLMFLREAALRGVQVALVVWDPAVSLQGTIPDPKGRREWIPGINDGPGAASVQARWTVPKGKGFWLKQTGSDHQKLVVADDRRGNLVAHVLGNNAFQPYWDTQAHDPADTRRVPFMVEGDPRAQLSKYPPLHDVGMKIDGPSALHVLGNVVERFNEATFKHAEDGVVDLAPKNVKTGVYADGVKTQITRTVAPKTLASIPHGERSIKESYLKAIMNAKRQIYFESQYFYDHEIVLALEYAANRGVRIIGLIAGKPDEGTPQGVLQKLWAGFAQDETMLPKLVGHGSIRVYTPAIAVADPKNPGYFAYRAIYVHAKVLIVDDEAFTLGSANISNFSMEFHTEMNALVYDRAGARDLRKRLWMEHLQLADIPDAVIDDPQRGYDLWEEHARDNGKAYIQRSEPKSRVFPFRTLLPDAPSSVVSF